MTKLAILCEKPSAARKFAAALGGMRGVWEENPYEILASHGHIFRFAPLAKMVPEDKVQKMTSWSINDLPFDRTAIKFRYELIPDDKNFKGQSTSDLFKSLKASINASDVVVIATDNDPSGEGETIGWEIINASQFKGQVLRCYFADESVVGLQRAMKKSNLKPVNHTDPVYLRGLTRKYFDYFTVQYTRALTDLAHKAEVIDSSRDMVVTGRLKGSMITLIGNAEMAHEMFKPHSDYLAVYMNSTGHRFKSKQPILYGTEDEARVACQSMTPSSVKKLSEKKQNKKPDRLPILSELPRLLRKEGVKSDDLEQTLLSTYQAMYQDDLVSYPRTADNVITHGQLNDLLPHVDDIAKVVGVDVNLLHKDNFRSYLLTKESTDDEDGIHGANRPGLVVPESIESLSRYGELGPLIYKILAKRFLAGFADDAIYNQCVYADESETYFYTQTTPIELGYKKIAAMIDGQDDDEEEDDTDITLVQIGDTLTPDTYEQKAKRPSLMTSDHLMDLLIKEHIGTGATQLSTFIQLCESNPRKNSRIVKTTKGKCRLTKLGQVAYLLGQKTALADLTVTKRLDDLLDQIKTQEKRPQDVFAFFDQMVAHDFDVMKANTKNLASLEKVKQRVLHEKVTRIYTPENKEYTINAGVGEHTFTEDELTRLFNGEVIQFTYNNRDAKGRLMKDSTYGFGFRFVVDTVKGVLRATQDKTKVAQSFVGKEIEFPNKVAGHTFTEDEVTKLLAGESISFSATSSKNKPFTASGYLKYTTGYKSKSKTKSWQFVMDFGK